MPPPFAEVRLAAPEEDQFGQVSAGRPIAKGEQSFDNHVPRSPKRNSLRPRRPKLPLERKRPRPRSARITIPIAVLAGAAVVGSAFGIASAWNGSPLDNVEQQVRAPNQARLAGCRVTDGDTLRCGAERVRLLGIDAPELPGHCRRGRQCAPGDPVAATRSLGEAAAGELYIERIGTDRYGRTLALVSNPAGDLSCHQLRAGMATYRRQWDNGGRVARLCPDAVD